MASPAAVLEILVTANSAHATTALARTDAQLKSTAATAQTTTSRMGQRFSALASVAKTALIGGVAYGLYSGAKAGIEFEKQMDAVGAVADASAKQMRKLEQQALRLGQKTAYSASEAAQAQEELAKGGLKASEILGGALKSSLSLAAAGQLDLGEAAMTTVNAMKLFGMRAKDAGRIADMFATAANKTTADVEDFAAALKQGGSAAKTAGYDLNETMTVLEALAEAGIKNSDAGTSMKTAFLQLLAPTEKQKQLAEQLNIQWTDQRGNLKSAAGLSKELQQALGGMTNAQQAANLKILAGTDGFRTLSALYDAGPAKLRELARANAEQGTAQEIAKKKMDNTAGSIEQLKGAWETLSISLFKKAESPFRSIIDGMTDAVQDLTDVVTDKKLTTDEKISKLADMVSHALAGAIPKVAKIAAKIGTTLIKGIADAFIHGDALTKIFIGAAALRLFGGPGVFTRLGGSMASSIGAGLKGGLAGLALAGTTYVIAQKLQEDAAGGTQLDRSVKKAVRIWEQYRRRVADITGGLKERYGSLTAAVAAMSDKQRKEYRKAALIAVRNGDITINEWQKMTRALDNTEARQERMWERAAKVTGQKTKDIKRDVGDMTIKVSKSYDNMVEVTGSGIDWLMKNTSSAMKALGLKQELHWNLQRHKTGPTGGGYGNQSRQTGGQIYHVPGYGSGDKVPALLEPGEVVLNRNAVAAMGGANKADRINKLVPRFAKGGSVTGGVELALGPYTIPPIQYDPNHAGGNSHVHIDMYRAADTIAVGKAMQKMGWVIDEYSGSYGGFGGVSASHASPGHYDGTAFDANTAEDETKSQVAAVARLLNTGRFAGGTAAAKQVARVVLEGPDGPLRTFGQRALDKVRNAANRYIASKSPAGDVVTGDYDGPVVAQMGKILLANGFTRAGAAGIIGNAYRESLWDPGSVGTGGGGLFGFTTSPVSLADLQNYAKKKGTAWTNVATQMAFMLGSPGGGGLVTDSYYNGLESFLRSTKNVHDATYRFMDEWERPGIPAFEDRYAGAQKAFSMSSWRLGGIVHLAKGGKADGKDLHGTATPGPLTTAFKRLRKARRIAERVKDLLGERGRVARIDERIANAETLAGLESSESGSETGPSELAKQIRLNEMLLAKLVMARKLIRSGIRLTHTPKGMSVDPRTEKAFKGLRGSLNTSLIDLVGLTGSGGRIFDVKVHLDELKHTTSGPEGVDISGLRSIIEAARYGVYDSMPVYHKGGLIPGTGQAPVMAKGGEAVLTPAQLKNIASPKVEVHNSFDFEGMDLIVTTTVNGEIAKRERINHRKGRQAVR